MNSERWKQVERVYYGVVASPSSRRSAILDELCLDDAEMRREVESLLEAREQAGSFLSQAHLQDQIRELDSESSLIGRTLDRYQILSTIGAGAMGDVYLARDTELDRKVALKALPERFTCNAARVARFRGEAKAASALNHPNIMAVYDIRQIGDTWFIATEFIEGVTLRERLAGGRLSWQESLGIAAQCARALEAAHQAGIVHRDVKPENIMVRPDGCVKVVDFGLARVSKTEQEGAADATQAGTLIGTPRYMSPEQARGEKLDRRADVFSLGAVFYEMVCGRRAFAGTSAAEVFAALLDSAPLAPSECVLGVPKKVDAIAAKALQKDREARYQSMGDLAADLENFKQIPERRLTNGMPAEVAPKRAGGDSLRPRIFPALTIAAVALALALSWLLRLNRRGRGPDTPSLSVLPLTSFGGYKDFAALSAEGSRIAFSWNGGTASGGSKLERSIYRKRIGPDEPVRLTFAAQDDRLPAWSPDGREIAFCRALTPEPDASRYAIVLVPAAGGRERTVAEGGRGVSWSPDGKMLVLADSPAASRGIVLLSLQTHKRRQLTSPGPDADTLPVFSPDGRWIAFTRDFGFAAREIFVVRAAGGLAKRLTFDRQPTYGAAWTGDSREIVFASNRGTGGESLWRIPVAGGAPRRLSATLEGGFYPSISRRGNLLAYTQSSKDTNIYVYSGAGFGGKLVPGRFGEAQGLILSSRRDDSPSISPDGERVAFVSTRTGNEEIWVCDWNGTHLVQLTSFHGPGTGTPRWSPDGQQIAFDSLAAGNPDIYLVSATGGRTPRRLTKGPFSNFMPSWSPDGKWIYSKSDRSGSDQLWKIPAEGGSPVQLTRGGASEGFASPDGRSVYFTKRAWSAIWTVPSGGGPERVVPELAHFDKIFRSWGVLDRGIYFLSREDSNRQTIRFFSFANRRVTPLVRLSKQPIWDYPDVALSRVGRLILFACIDGEVNDLMLIENFH